MAGRRFSIHPPYLVDRIPPGLLKKDPEQAMKVMVRVFDQAMQELHRYLRYLLNANDEAQSILGDLTGEAGDGLLSEKDIHAKIMIRVSLDF